MPKCCHLPPKGPYVSSLEKCGKEFAKYVGGGGFSCFSKSADITSALHLEMLLWRPSSGKLGPRYRVNDAEHNSWQAMRPRYVPSPHSASQKKDVFNQIIQNFSKKGLICACPSFDQWILTRIQAIRADALRISGSCAKCCSAPKLSALQTIGMAQKLVNIFLKYELCWQLVGQWINKPIPKHFSPYTARFPVIDYICALHAPIDSILLAKIFALPIGQYLNKKGLLQKARLRQSCGVLSSWSNLECLRTYYGFQLVLRRIAMVTWPKGCACSAPSIAASQQWFNQMFKSESTGQTDWIQEASEIPEEIIQQTVAKLVNSEKTQACEIEIAGSGDLR